MVGVRYVRETSYYRAHGARNAVRMYAGRK